MASYDFSAAFASSFSQVGGDQPDKTLLTLLKEYLGIDPEDTTQDDALEQALNFAGDAMESYIDKQVVKRSVTEYYAHHFGTVELHHMPVDLTVPVIVTLDGDEQTDYKVTVYRGKTAWLSRIGHRWDAPQSWSEFEQVEVTYTAGYEPIPSDLAQAIVYTAGAIFTSTGTGAMPGGATGEMKGATIFDVGSMQFDVGSDSGGGGWGDNEGGIIPSKAMKMVTKYVRMAT